MNKLFNLKLLACAFTLSLISCESNAVTPSSMVQVCAPGVTDRDALISLTRQFADEHNLRFQDGSYVSTRDEIRRRIQGDSNILPIPVTNIVVTGSGNFRIVIVSGVTEKEMIIGIGPRIMSSYAERLSRTYIEQIKARWQTEDVPEGERAQGMMACS